MHNSQARTKFNEEESGETKIQGYITVLYYSLSLRRNLPNEQRKSKDFWSITNRPITQEKDKKEQKEKEREKEKETKKIKPSIQKVNTKNLFSNEGLQKI